MTGRVNIEKFNKGFADDANKINPSFNNNNISEYPRKTTDEQPIKIKTNNETSVRIESEVVRGRAALKSSRTTTCVVTPSKTTTTAKTTPSSEAQPITTTSTELCPTLSPQRSQVTLTTTSSTTLPSTTPTKTPSTPPTTTPTTVAKQEGASVAFESESRSLCSRKRNRTEEKDGCDPNVAKAQKTVVESSRETIKEVHKEEEEKEEEEEISEEEEGESEERESKRDRRRISLWHKKQLVMFKIKQEEIDLSPFGIDGEHDVKESVLSVNQSTK